MSDNEKATNSDEIHQESGIGLQHAEIHDLPPDPDAHLSEAEKAEVVRLLQFLIPPGFFGSSIHCAATVPGVSHLLIRPTSYRNANFSVASTLH